MVTFGGLFFILWLSFGSGYIGLSQEKISQMSMISLEVEWKRLKEKLSEEGLSEVDKAAIERDMRLIDQEYYRKQEIENEIYWRN